LQRIILNKGEVTVMEPSLEDDLDKLDSRMRELSDRAMQRLEGGKLPELAPSTPGPSLAPPKTLPTPSP
jgi:hypothetical protein